jgi:hypothetical protein
LKKKRQALYATNFSATKLLHSRQMPQNKEAEFKEKKKGSKKKKTYDSQCSVMVASSATNLPVN